MDTLVTKPPPPLRACVCAPPYRPRPPEPQNELDAGFQGCLGKSMGCSFVVNQQFGPLKIFFVCILASPEDPCRALLLVNF